MLDRENLSARLFPDRPRDNSRAVRSCAICGLRRLDSASVKPPGDEQTWSVIEPFRPGAIRWSFATRMRRWLRETRVENADRGGHRGRQMKTKTTRSPVFPPRPLRFYFFVSSTGIGPSSSSRCGAIGSMSGRNQTRGLFCWRYCSSSASKTSFVDFAGPSI